MKKICVLIPIFLSLISCKEKSERYTYFLDWILEPGTGHVLMEPGVCINPVYGNQFSNNAVFIEAQEGQPVYSPLDGVVKDVMDIVIKYPDQLGAISWNDMDSFLEDVKSGENPLISGKNICSCIGISGKDGKTVWLEGLTDYSLKPGDQITRGQKIGNIGFIRTFSESPCISISGESKTDIIVFNDNPEKIYYLDSKTEKDEGYNPKKKLSNSQLIQDFDLFYTYINEDHPALLDLEIQKQFNEAYQKTKSEIKGKETSADFKKQLLKCIALLNCSHTKITSENQKEDTKAFPLILEYNNGKCFLLADLRKNNKLAEGMQILSINGKSVSEIYEEISSLMGFDSATSDVKSELNKYILSEYFSFYNRRKLNYVKYIDLTGKQKKAFISPISKIDIGEITLPEAETDDYPRYSDLFTITENHEAYITIQRIDQLANKEKLRQIFQQIKDSAITQLTIDLRDNPGGNIENAANFFAFFAQKPYKMYEFLEIRHSSSYKSIKDSLNLFDENLYNGFVKSDDSSSWRLYNDKIYEPESSLTFDGKITVLINAATSSAAVRLAQMLQDAGAELKGSETSGGAYFSNGITFTQVLLPNSNLILKMPLYRVVYKNDNLKSEGLRP